MDSIFDTDKYLSLPKEKSYQLSHNVANLKVLKGIMLGVIFFFAISFTVSLASRGSFSIGIGIMLADLIILVSAMILYKKIFNENNIKRYIFYFFILHVIILIGIGLASGNIAQNKNSTKKNKAKTDTTANKTNTDSAKETSKDTLIKVQKDTSSNTNNIKISTGSDADNNSEISPFMFFFCIALLVFRLTKDEIYKLNAIFFIPPILVDIFILKNNQLDDFLPIGIMFVLFMGLALFVEHRRKKKYYKEYDVMYKKNFQNIRMRKELEYAQQIQLSMLPEKSAVINNLEISAISIPATEVGGDYYDYFKLTDEKVGLFICDVSGHGVASALLLSGIRSCMHLILEETHDPKIIFTKLNRVIRKTQNRKMFVTAIFAVIDTKENKCTLFNAGHLPPYKISGETNEIYKLKKHGITLGATDNLYADESKEVIIDFNKGDKLLLYTDGVNEAQNEKRDEYSIERVEEFLNSNSNKKPVQIIDELVADVNKFTANKIQSDDLTIMAIERIN